MSLGSLDQQFGLKQVVVGVERAGSVDCDIVESWSP